MNFLRKNTLLFLLGSLTLGLAPFNPPHILGKLQWIAGGGAFSGNQPMKLDDWLDLLMHGTPLLLLLISLMLRLIFHLKTKKDKSL